MKRNTIAVFALTTIITLISCNIHEHKQIKLSKPNKEKLLTDGEWISNIDSMSGISIRSNKIAFFKNMKFSGEDVCDYELIDSVYKSPESEKIVGEYILLVKNLKDTSYYQITNRSKNSLTLKINNQKETFNLKPKK
ncbi:hypothetical protein [Flavobacterium sp. AG291]|uniref:hypothetical protein n=1 Tax=Flavobacterium sp. AG291 TaxID=2184000 RepID=UPI000E0A2469|nr:hypothetical protein [Flavobacterium sp. AG291]RDI10263.1 hypothetical protein DEU42_10880 [Flavobacterium sp. AG291]